VAHASFKGLRVLSLESRRAKEAEKLIRTYGGEAIVVPAMREIGLESNEEVMKVTGRVRSYCLYDWCGRSHHAQPG
jgi:uroporphyrinogen-III synthase